MDRAKQELEEKIETKERLALNSETPSLQPLTGNVVSKRVIEQRNSSMKFVVTYLDPERMKSKIASSNTINKSNESNKRKKVHVDSNHASSSSNDSDSNSNSSSSSNNDQTDHKSAGASQASFKDPFAEENIEADLRVEIPEAVRKVEIGPAASGTLDDYNLILNKFPIVRQHLVLATKTFETQVTPMTEADIENLYFYVHCLDALGFFNCGPGSGMSIDHKHMQIISAKQLGEIPMASVIQAYTEEQQIIPGNSFKVSEFRFEHAVHIFDMSKLTGRQSAPSGTGSTGSSSSSIFSKTQYSTSISDPSDRSSFHIADVQARRSYLFETFLELRKMAGIGSGTSYNFLMMQHWCMIVPRSRDSFKGVFINSLGFAGHLLVKDKEVAARVLDNEELGPMAVLENVGVSKSSL